MSNAGYLLRPEELTGQVHALATIGDRAGAIAGAADQLAGRLAPLGTAPPALHLAMRLREAAGATGLSGEIGASHDEVRGFHQALSTTVANYLDREDEVASALRSIENGGLA